MDVSLEFLALSLVFHLHKLYLKPTLLVNHIDRPFKRCFKIPLNDIEDLAILLQHSRESDKVGPEDCLSTEMAIVYCCVMDQTFVCCMSKVAQFRKAENVDDEMA